MKKNMYVFSALGAAFLMLCSTSSHAQILFNNGGLVYVTTGCIVQVNGGFQDDNIVAGPGVVDNEGDMTVTSNGSWPGNIWLTNTAILQGNGKYHLEQDWINDAVFTHGKSTVDMYGNLKELITSNNSTVTKFDILLLQGTGSGANRRKQQTLDAIVDSLLILNDRVLFTAGHTLFVNTPNINAVTNTIAFGSEGLVSSLGTGSLSRLTNLNSAYFFPVGADSNVLRYRKVLLTPAAASANRYTVRLANNDASNDGDSIGLIDTNLCKVNPLFYHKINHPTGPDNADIDIFYDPVADGIWTAMAQWNTPTPILWNDMGAVTYTPSSPYSDVLKKSWGNFTNDPFILGNDKPSPPILSCQPICKGTPGTYTATGGGTSYTWTVPGGDTIKSGQGTGSITTSGTVAGTITVISNFSGCKSKAATCNVSFLPSPIVGFDTMSIGMFHTTWGFTDTSKSSIVNWYWTFGDGGADSIFNPAHQYAGAGTYVVTEVVTNSSGCRGMKTDTLVVPEGILIPNVFTPNGDGQNDQFTISNSGVKSFSIEIFNRWGEKVFESTSSQISWDGRTNAGVMVSDGTYYYMLKATAVSGKVWDQHGFLTVITGK